MTVSWKSIDPKKLSSGQTPLEKVSIDVKVVAAGIEGTGAGRKVRMSLVLSPVLRSDSPGSIDLTRWPAEVDAIARELDPSVPPKPGQEPRLSFWMSPMAGNGDNRPWPQPKTAHRLHLKLSGKPAQSDVELETLTAAWQHLMAPEIIDGWLPWVAGDACAWTDLRDVIRDGSADPNAVSDSPLDDKHVVGVPRGDIALFLSIWRSRVVLAALEGRLDKLADPGCDVPGFDKTWNPSAAAGTLLRNPDSRASVQKSIKDGAFIKAKKQYDSRSKYLAAESIEDAVKALFEVDVESCHCAAPSGLLDMLATAGDKHGLADKDALEQILLRYWMAQREAQNPDEPPTTAPPPDSLDTSQADLKTKQIDWTIPTTKNRYFAQSRLFALQTNPALARVFGFVIDVSVPLADVEKGLKALGSLPFLEADTIDFDAPKEDGERGLRPNSDSDTETHYLFLRCSLSGTAGAASSPGVDSRPPPQTWTTAKLRLPSPEASAKGAVGHFLPCTREEIDIAAFMLAKPKNPLIAHGGYNDGGKRNILPAVLDGAIKQFDGVVDLGAGRRAVKFADRRPRFDVVTLESIGALENQISLVRATQDSQGNLARPLQRPTLMTEGVVIVDRWRSAEYVAQMADSAHHEQKWNSANIVVLDAHDLTLGARVDVGIRLVHDPKDPRARHTEDRHVWRALGVRSIKYAFAGKQTLDPRLQHDSDFIEHALERLGYKAGTLERVHLDEAMAMPTASGSSDGSRRHPEEILASWNGEPMGLQCRQEKLYVDPRKGLGVSMTYAFPEDSSYKLPRLLFGRRYRIGLRQVYLGGVSTPLARAAALYEEAAGGTLAMPGAPRRRQADGATSPIWNTAEPDVPRILGRRFLRHERIKAPEILLPQATVIEADRRAKKFKPIEVKNQAEADAKSEAEAKLKDAKEKRDAKAVTEAEAKLKAANKAISGSATERTFHGYPLQGAATATLRKALPVKGKDVTLDLDSIVRIVVAPNEPQDFVLRHGMIGAHPDLCRSANTLPEAERKVRLLDGLPNVRYDADRGGFPVRMPPDSKKPIDTRHPSVPMPPATGSSVCNVGTTQTKGGSSTGGDAVFVVKPTPSEDHAARALPYFPDPAARSLVLAVRRVRAGDAQSEDQLRDEDYLEGEPLIVPLTADIGTHLRSYPNNTLSLFLDIKAAGDDQKSAPRTATQHKVLLHNPDDDTGVIKSDSKFTPQNLRQWKVGDASTPARRITIELVPGESFWLDMWCLPSVNDLMDWFDVVESAAMLSVARGRTLHPSGSSDMKCAAGLIQLTGGKLDLKRFANYDPGELIGFECGAASADLPCAETQGKIAAALYDHMKRRPLREIAAVRSMRVTYALSQPRAPAFIKATAVRAPVQQCIEQKPTASDHERTGIALLRKSNYTGARDADKSTLDRARASFVASAGKQVEMWTFADHQKGATDLLVGGRVSLDLQTASGVSLLADMVSPRSSRLDDPTRGRHPDMLGKPLRKWNRAKPNEAWDDSSEIYGFEVIEDGTVRFRLQREVLMRLENLPPPTADGIASVDLLLNEQDGVKRMWPETQLKRLYVPADTKARRMIVTLQAHNRFRDSFVDYDTTKNALDLPGVEWLSTSYSTGDSHRDPAPDVGVSSKGPQKGQVELWIPATEPPRPIDPKSIIPAFVWRERHERLRYASFARASQRMIVRLRFRRPWFSSGEGERLGIVLWPPTIFDASKHSMFDSLFRGEGKEPNERAKDYITNWAADPIGQGNVAVDPFMPPETFADAYNSRTDVMHVPGVRVPIPLKEGEHDKSESFDAALLAYTPRFDVLDESWYVDVELATGDLANCFVQFGIVRYQPAAICEWSVSDPTTVMVQILPEREITVKRELVKPRGRDPELHVIDVEVAGQASLRAADDPELDDTPDAPKNDVRHRPVIRPKLVVIDTMDTGQTEVRLAECKKKQTEDVNISPGRSGRGLSWKHQFILQPSEVLDAAERMQAGIKRRTFRVVLDEVNLMRSTGKDNETKLVPSGPRFAAAVNVPEFIDE